MRISTSFTIFQRNQNPLTFKANGETFHYSGMNGKNINTHHDYLLGVEKLKEVKALHQSEDEEN